MAITHGMNIEEVRNLGRQLQQQADNLRSLVGQLEGAVNSASWLGPDATTFKSQWWPEHRAHLQQAAEGLHGFGQSALNNAQDQENTAAH